MKVDCKKKKNHIYSYFIYIIIGAHVCLKLLYDFSSNVNINRLQEYNCCHENILGVIFFLRYSSQVKI